MSRVHPFCGVASRTVCGSAEGNVTGQVLAELCWAPKGSCKRAATVSSTAAAVAAGVRFRSHTWLRRRMQSARAAATTPHWSLSWSRLLGLDTDCRSSPRSYQARLRKVTLRESTTRARDHDHFEGCRRTAFCHSHLQTVHTEHLTYTRELSRRFARETPPAAVIAT